MKMYCKYCDHEKNGSKLLLLVDKEISLRTCGTETSGRGFPNSNEGDLLEGLGPGKMGTEPSQGGHGVGSRGFTSALRLSLSLRMPQSSLV